MHVLITAHQRLLLKFCGSVALPVPTESMVQEVLNIECDERFSFVTWITVIKYNINSITRHYQAILYVWICIGAICAKNCELDFSDIRSWNIDKEVSVTSDTVISLNSSPILTC